MSLLSAPALGLTGALSALVRTVIKGYLGTWTLIIKSLALVSPCAPLLIRTRSSPDVACPLCSSLSQPLAIASGLSVGKEGPSVHMACCVGNVIGGFFERFATSHSASVSPRGPPTLVRAAWPGR